MNFSGAPLTILDFEIAVTELQKYGQELFAGTNEKKKLHVLEVMRSLVDPSTTDSIKTPIEDTETNTNTDNDSDSDTIVNSDTENETDCDTDSESNSVAGAAQPPKECRG